jgi:hypothetical protein
VALQFLDVLVAGLSSSLETSKEALAVILDSLIAVSGKKAVVGSDAGELLS